MCIRHFKTELSVVFKTIDINITPIYCVDLYKYSVNQMGVWQSICYRISKPHQICFELIWFSIVWFEVKWLSGPQLWGIGESRLNVFSGFELRRLDISMFWICFSDVANGIDWWAWLSLGLWPLGMHLAWLSPSFVGP